MCSNIALLHAEALHWSMVWEYALMLDLLPFITAFFLPFCTTATVTATSLLQRPLNLLHLCCHIMHCIFSCWEKQLNLLPNLWQTSQLGCILITEAPSTVDLCWLLEDDAQLQLYTAQADSLYTAKVTSTPCAEIPHAAAVLRCPPKASTLLQLFSA